MVGQRMVWYALVALGQDTRSDDVGHLGQHTRSDDIGHGLSSYPLDNTHGRPKLGMTCHHRPWTAHTDGQRQVWPSIMILRQQTW